MGATLRRVLVPVLLVAALLLMPGSSAGAQSCVAGTANDFDGDGVADIAIADPDATVDGHLRAGRVHVVYGGGGSQTISQADTFVGAVPEAGDRFGFSLGSVDYNGDGCSDLVVGTPFEALGSLSEAGYAQVLYGSSAGFGPGGQLSFSQDTTGMAGGAEEGDRFGFSLAAGETTSGSPFLVFGVPGEDLDDDGGVSQPDAGAFHYVRGSMKLLVHQRLVEVFGTLEAGDLYGYSVAASARHVVVGGPGETVASASYAGTVGVFTHDVAAGTTDGWDQDQSGDSGLPEGSDWCGRSLAITDYIPPGGSAGNTRSLLAIGCPGEALGTTRSAGRLVTLNTAGTVSEVESVTQDDVGVDDSGEAADYFGWAAQVVNRAPGSPATWQNLLVAVGVPGEEVDSRRDGGGVQVFSAIGPPGDHDRWAQMGEQGARLGQYLGGSRTHLYVGDPYGTSPAVYAIPWQDIINGTTGGVREYRPGLDGLPTSGVGTFGGAIV